MIDYTDLVGKKLYGESLLSYKGLYVYTVIGCGQFLNHEETDSYPRVILRNDSPCRDAVGYAFPMGKLCSVTEYSIAPDEIGTDYFLSEEEAKEALINKYRYFDVSWVDGMTIDDLKYHQLQTESSKDGSKKYYYKSLKNTFSAKEINYEGDLEWYFHRNWFSSEMQPFAKSYASEGHILHVYSPTVNFWDI